MPGQCHAHADDPLYGGENAGKSPGIQLGNVVLRGENGVLRINPPLQVPGIL